MKYKLKPPSCRSFRNYPRTEREIERSRHQPIHGVGINDANYLVHPTDRGHQKRCSYYLTWKNMISRCYNAKQHIISPTYARCTVTPEWHSFMTFRAWMQQQRWRGKHLDKDIILKGNKVYAPLTCMFVPPHVNALLLDRESRRGTWPVGVHRTNGKMRKFRAQMRIGVGKKSLGNYVNASAAADAYAEGKASYIRSLIPMMKGEDPRLGPALERVAESMWPVAKTH